MFDLIHTMATALARLEAQDVDNNTDWYPCGSAVIVIDGRSKYGKWLLENNKGYKNFGGVTISARYPSQKMEVNIAFAEKFKQILTLNGVKIKSIKSWID